MCKSLALLSGKGGSGKTTLALSMATMLSECGIKVLLIDCDLSTNGATYFYEEKLVEKKNRVTSFHDILFDKPTAKMRFIEINECFHFLPSLTEINKKNINVFKYRDDQSFSIYDELCSKYDVILFDCQAGYTDILKLILPHIDINLVVMEADAISSASIRSLYLKIGDMINEKKLFQVFNKASQEEYEIYSKVSGGTVFINIDTIRFDWKIRKAFAVSQIPDMKKTSANYGKQIYNLCSSLFKGEAVQEKLRTYKTFLDIHSYQEEQEIIQKKINSTLWEQQNKRSGLSRSLTLLMLLLFSLIFCVVFVAGLKFYDGTRNTEFFMALPIMLSLLTLSLSCLNIFDLSKEKREYGIKIGELRKQLDDITKKIETTKKTSETGRTQAQKGSKGRKSTNV